MRSLKIIFGLLVCVLLASAFETEVNGDNYIVGGRPATRHQFPWIVSLRSATNDHFCGGFILSDRWVGSAAHCTFGSRAVPANVIIASAAHTRFDGNRHRVARIVNHPRYNRQHMIFDISIIQTADRIPITPNGPVRTIRFPTGPVVHDGQTVFFAGWGLTGPRGQGPAPLPNVLQWKPSMTIPRAECIQRQGPARARFVHADTVCTSNPDGKGACNGDSGGPLVDQQGLCVGIASWVAGGGCARGYPDVFAKLWTAIPFYRQVTQNTIPNLPRGPQ